MDLDVTIERIENGFIVTEGERHRYYASMRDLVDQRIGEPMDSADRHFREHDMVGAVRRLIFRVEAVE